MFDEFAHPGDGRDTGGGTGELLVAQFAGGCGAHRDRVRDGVLVTRRDRSFLSCSHPEGDGGALGGVCLPRHHENDAPPVDGGEHGTVGRMRDGRVETPRHDVDHDVGIEHRFGTIGCVHRHAEHEMTGTVVGGQRLVARQGPPHTVFDGLAADSRATRHLHPERSRMPGQRPAQFPPRLRVELFGLRGEAMPQIPRHDPPIVAGDCGRDAPGRQTDECFPEKTLWSLESLLPHTREIRDNGRVNEADQHTTETLDERPTRGNRLYPRVTSFRSRRGSLTDPQQQSWDRRWPELGKEVGDEPLDVDAWFGRSAPLVLEIGSGTGTAAVAMAQAEPNIDLIAVEVYKPGIAQTLQAVERTYDSDTPVTNLRILRGDAVEVLEKMLTSESLTGVRVFFPDPWPKARHHKRRLLQAPTFALIADRLKPGGVLHVATDHADYAEAIAEVGDAEPRLARFSGVPPISLERPVTKFEDKAHQVGSAINEFVWGKIGA